MVHYDHPKLKIKQISSFKRQIRLQDRNPPLNV